MLNIIIYLLLAMMPYGSPELEEIIFEPSNFPSRFVEPEAVYFNHLRHNYKTYNNQSNYSQFKILEI